MFELSFVIVRHIDEHLRLTARSLDIVKSPKWFQEHNKCIDIKIEVKSLKIIYKIDWTKNRCTTLESIHFASQWIYFVCPFHTPVISGQSIVDLMVFRQLDFETVLKNISLDNLVINCIHSTINNNNKYDNHCLDSFLEQRKPFDWCDSSFDYSNFHLSVYISLNENNHNIFFFMPIPLRISHLLISTRKMHINLQFISDSTMIYLHFQS